MHLTHLITASILALTTLAAAAALPDPETTLILAADRRRDADFMARMPVKDHETLISATATKGAHTSKLDAAAKATDRPRIGRRQVDVMDEMAARDAKKKSSPSEYGDPPAAERRVGDVVAGMRARDARKKGTGSSGSSGSSYGSGKKEGGPA